MRIQIDGSGSINKGAELMLAAVLQEIRKRYPGTEVIVNSKTANKEFIANQYGDNFIIPRSGSFYSIVERFHFVGLLNLFSIAWGNYFTLKHAPKNVDMILDVGGFQFGDQWQHNKYEIDSWEAYLKMAHKKGSKFVFMPQAFGPFQKNESKSMLRVLANNADLLIARDNTSYSYIKEISSNNNILLYPDFTTLVKPQETEFSKRNKGKVCIIPNSKIIQMGTMDKDSYLNTIIKIIDFVYSKNREVVLLNHEGDEDLKLCEKIKEETKQSVEIVSGLNAVETKGVISTAFLVISSRFHGVANSLSSCVPCLATSWSHKYQKLLEEYEQNECLLDLSKSNEAIEKVGLFLDIKKNDDVRDTLSRNNINVRRKNNEMWDTIWSVL